MIGAVAEIRLVINYSGPSYFGRTPIRCFLCMNSINGLCVNEK